MIAFWSVFLLLGYGVLGELRYFLKNPVLSKWFGLDTTAWTSVPLLGDFGLASLIAVIIQVVIGIIIYRFINRPKIYTTLAETEDEMRKVTWPTWSETWSGTLAVMITVVVLLLFLFAADAVYVQLFSWLLGGGSA